MITSQRKRRRTLNRRTELLSIQRSLSAAKNRVWERMPAVGREFGSPDFDRLMEEDFLLRRGVFDPVLAVGSKAPK